MLECSEVLAGVKPANLVSLVNRLRPCGRNLYQLRQSHHQLVVIRLGNIAFLLLKTRERAASGNHKALELDNPEHPFFCHDIDTDIQYRRGYNP